MEAGPNIALLKWNIIINESHLHNLIKSLRKKERKIMSHATTIIFWPVYHRYTLFTAHTCPSLVFCSYPFVFYFSCLSSLISSLCFIFLLNFDAPLSFGSTPTTQISITLDRPITLNRPFIY